MTGKRKRRVGWPLIVTAVVVVAVVAVIGLLSIRGSQPDWRERYQVITAETIAFQDTIEVSGNIEPLQARDLAFPVSGKVIAVGVEEGEAVERGTLLVRLDDRVARYELAAVEASLERTRLSGSARELRLLELERAIKAQAVEDRELRSPMDGRLSVLDIQAGDYVAAGRVVARIVDISSLKARVQIDELDAPTVRVGQPVRFGFDALPELDIQGRMSDLSLEGRITSAGLTVIDGEVVIDDPPRDLLVGYSFVGEILVGEEQRVLVIPETALNRDGDQIFVYVLPENESEPEPRNVDARILDAERIQIVSGLSEGDRILVPLFSQTGREIRATLTTRGLLESLQQQARVPFLGGKRQPETP